MKVYVAQHVEWDNISIIGVYSSLEAAEESRNSSGWTFNEHQKLFIECFDLDQHYSSDRFDINNAHPRLLTEL